MLLAAVVAGAAEAQTRWVAAKEQADLRTGQEVGCGIRAGSIVVAEALQTVTFDTIK